MKTTFRQIENVAARIGECDSEIALVQSLPFYSIFRQESRREKDLAQLRALRQELSSQKAKLLLRLKEEVETQLAVHGSRFTVYSQAPEY